MYDSRPNLIIGFHGCDEAVKQKLINSSNSIQISQKPHDWLGHGMCFWENNHDRAMERAENKKKRGEIETPAVVGAVLQLGSCGGGERSSINSVMCSDVDQQNIFGLILIFFNGEDNPAIIAAGAGQVCAQLSA